MLQCSPQNQPFRQYLVSVHPDQQTTDKRARRRYDANGSFLLLLGRCLRVANFREKLCRKPSFREHPLQKLFDKSEWAPFWGPTRAVKRGEKRPYCALGHQKYAIQTLTAIFQTVSEGVFSETQSL